MKGVRCLVFDIDDTLYLERDYIRSGFVSVDRWLEQVHGISGFGDAAWSAFGDGVRGNTFDVALVRLGVEPRRELIEEMVSIYRAHEPTIALTADSRQCLDDWRGHAILAVVTDGFQVSQQAKIKALGLSRWVDHAVVTSVLGDGFCKPHPLAFRMVERLSGWKGRACAYVGDNPVKDFGGPRDLGWRTVRVRRVGGLYAGIDAPGCADIEITDLSSLRHA